MYESELGQLELTRNLKIQHEPKELERVLLEPGAPPVAPVALSLYMYSMLPMAS